MSTEPPNNNPDNTPKRGGVGSILFAIITAFLIVVLFLIFFMSFLNGPLLLLAIAGLMFWATGLKKDSG